MKTCFKCNKEMQKAVVIDGKRRNLQNRKFCLECSPFGKHNTKKDDPSRPSIRGSEDGKVKKYSDWTEEGKEKNRLYVWEKGNARKQKLVDIKGGCCQVCGYNKCLRALTFHHRDPSEKQFELGTRSIRGLGWDCVLKEAEKCDLLCYNCHQEIEDQIARKNSTYHNQK